MSCVDQSFPELFITMLLTINFVQLFSVLTHWETVLGLLCSLCPSILKIPTCSWPWLCVPKFYQPKSHLFSLSSHRDWCWGRKSDGTFLLLHIIVYFYSGLSPLLNYKTLYSRICLFLSNFVSFPVLQVLDSQSVSVNRRFDTKDKNLKYRNLKIRFSPEKAAPSVSLESALFTLQLFVSKWCCLAPYLVFSRRTTWQNVFPVREELQSPSLLLPHIQAAHLWTPLRSRITYWLL